MYIYVCMYVCMFVCIYITYIDTIIYLFIKYLHISHVS